MASVKEVLPLPDLEDFLTLLSKHNLEFQQAYWQPRPGQLVILPAQEGVSQCESFCYTVVSFTDGGGIKDMVILSPLDKGSKDVHMVVLPDDRRKLIWVPRLDDLVRICEEKSYPIVMASYRRAAHYSVRFRKEEWQAGSLETALLRFLIERNQK